MFDTRTKNEIADVLNFLTGFDTDAMSKNRKEVIKIAKIGLRS